MDNKNTVKSDGQITKEELASWFQEKFSDKTLSFGCLMQHKEYPEDHGYEYIAHSDHRDTTCVYDIDSLNYEHIITDRLETIGHPLTRGRLYQEVIKSLKHEEIELYSRAVKISTRLSLIEKNLLHSNILDKTIYERVENEYVREILIELKELIENQ